MKCPPMSGTFDTSAAVEDVHTRRARPQSTKAGTGRAALRPGPFLSAALSV